MARAIVTINIVVQEINIQQGGYQYYYCLLQDETKGEEAWVGALNSRYSHRHDRIARTIRDAIFDFDEVHISTNGNLRCQSI